MYCFNNRCAWDPNNSTYFECVTVIKVRFLCFKEEFIINKGKFSKRKNIFTKTSRFSNRRSWSAYMDKFGCDEHAFNLIGAKRKEKL